MKQRETGAAAVAWSLAGAIAASVAAAVCCLGPMALVALGVTGAWIGSLSALEPYSPLFILLAAGLFATAFVKVYRRQRATGEIGDAPEIVEKSS